MYIPFLALRYLRSRLVNLIAVGGVMMGVAVLLVVSSVMDGFRVRVLEVLRGNLSDIVMTPLGQRDETVPPFELMSAEIEKDPRVLATSPQLEHLVFFMWPSTYRGQLSVGDYAVHQMRAVGIDWKREKNVSKIASYMRAANRDDDPFFSQRKIDFYKEGSVVLSKTFVRNFEPYLRPGRASTLLLSEFLDEDASLTFLHFGTKEGTNGASSGQITGGYRSYALPISGIYQGGDTTMDVQRVYFDIDTLRRIARLPDEYHNIRVRLSDPDLAEAVKADFRGRFPGFITKTWRDHRADYLRAVNNEKVLLAIVLSFIVLLGGFIILATLTLTVVEKTRDIGVLGALGATHQGILGLFVGNGLLIGIIGSLLGVGLGRLVVDNANWIKDDLLKPMGIDIFPEKIYLFEQIPTIWDWNTVAWIVGGSILTAFVSGLIPALRAARMDPVRALRYE